MARKKLTAYDLLQIKGKRQLSEVFVNNVEEAAAAEEAGMDILATSYDAPQFGIYSTFDDMKRIREACPNTHLMMGPPYMSYSSPYEAIKAAYELMKLGADSVYTPNSVDWIKTMRKENIPVISHVGLIPAKSAWIGGFRAVGKTADEALQVLREAIALDEAGAIAIEVEVVPVKVAAEITKRVKLITISMGSGSECDAQYLFSQDILGWNTGHMPRHSRVYRHFAKEYERLQKERVAAYKEFIQDVQKKTFNDPKITIGIDDREFEKFMKQADSV
jgi:3-methyl-2-oxobutanoate hydroxymethyltransferase